MSDFQSPRTRHRAAFAILVAPLALLIGCARPTHDQHELKSIEAESQILMMTKPPKAYVTVPETQWPSIIGTLKPKRVTIYPDGIEIMMEPYFDGGWGYFVPRTPPQLPEPVGRFSELGQGVYWYQPY